ncbi:MAG: hypothetical protein SGI99_16755, partial [Pseudomonadota bacterium]|nr:hypothetical protein [Pseudomonadota bacterium]
MKRPLDPPLFTSFAGLRCVVAALSASTLILGFALLTPVHGQASGGLYSLNAHALSAGGGRAAGGVYTLEGSIGQHDASNPQTGGMFELTGGFHRRAPSALGSEIFRNGFE